MFLAVWNLAGDEMFRVRVIRYPEEDVGAPGHLV